MRSADQSNNVTVLASALRRAQITNWALAGACALLFVMYVGAKGDTKTLLAPMQLAREVAVTGKHMDQAYLEEIGPDVADLFLTVNPKTLPASKERLLRLVHPTLYGEMSNRIDLQGERLKKENASQVFWPTQVLADPAHNRVAVFGQLATYINDRRTSDVPRVWVAELAFSGSRMWVKAFDERALDDPFGLKPAPEKKPAPTDTPKKETADAGHPNS